MFRRHSRAYRITLMTVVLLVLGGTGYFAYRMYSTSKTDLDLPAAAEKSYERGRMALETSELGEARSSFDEADKLTLKGFELLKKETSSTRNPTGAVNKEWEERRGKLLWLKARILRDAAFTNALIESKPLAETEDSVTREMFRSVTSIPDPDSKKEASECLREAGYILKRDPTVQQEALRLEMMSTPPDWGQIQRLSKNILEITPENVRAHYNLARMEYLQPQESKNGEPLPDKDKSRERVEEARKHLQTVKESPLYPVWRVLHLESQIMQWLVKKPLPSAQLDPKIEKEKLRAVYFDPETGALARARKKEGFVALGKFDIEGLVGLHVDAVKLGIDQAKASMGSQADDLFIALKALANLGSELAATKYGKDYLASLLEASTSSALSARRYLGADTPVEWPGIRDSVEKLARQIADANKSAPVGYAQLAQLLNNEAYLEGRKKNAELKKDLETRALSWVDEGLRLATENNEPTGNLTSLHGVALEIMAGRGDGMDKMKPHIDKLKRINDKRANAIVGIQEAASLVRQGKLNRAEESLKALLENTEAKDLKPRAITLLASIYLSLQKPDQALTYLRELERSYKDLNSAERAFIIEFLRDPQELAVLIVEAELETALEKLARYRVEHPGRPNPDQATIRTVQSHEEDAQGALKKLIVGKDAHRQASATLVKYLIRQQAFDRARQVVKELEEPYSNSADVLRLRVAVALLPEKNKRDEPASYAQRKLLADGIIKEFITNNPTDMVAKRFWVEWLIRTNRGDDAMTYLNDPANFPGERDEATKKLLGLLMLANGKRDEGLTLLQELPKDSSIELILIQATANPIQRQQLLDEALAKNENNGGFRILQAEKLFAEDKFAEATEKFSEAREFTRVRQLALSGLVKSLQRLAETDPDKALQTAEQLMKEAPNEALYYSIAALALMKKDDFGIQTDAWENRKSMWGAINRWKSLAGRNGVSPAGQLLFASKFLVMANRTDDAWKLLEQTAASNPPNEEILLNMVMYALQLNEKAYLDKAKDYLAILRQIRPQSSNYRTLDAQLSIARDDYERAVGILEPIVDAEPKAVGVYPMLIGIFNRAGDTAKAAAWTQQFLKAAPDNTIAIQEQIRQYLTTGQIDKATAMSAEFAVEAVDRIEKKMLKSKDVDLDRINKAKIQSLRAAANLILAQTWQEGGNLDGAQEYLNRSMRDKPGNMAARLIDAQLSMARKDWVKAREIYDGILKDDKENYVAKSNLAFILAQHLDQPAEALKIVRGMMAGPFSGKPLAPERLAPEFLDTLGTVFHQANLKNLEPGLPDEMKAIFDVAARRYPSDPRIHLHLGEAYQSLADKPMAIATYQKSLQLAKEGKGPMAGEVRRDFIQKVNERIKGL